MSTCTRRFHFCYGHRVWGHENKCSNLHGHGGIVFITAEADSLDSVGRVVDFSVIKERYGDWIESNWDHGMLLHKDDVEAIQAVSNVSNSLNQCSKLFLLDVNPTAENMAQLLLSLGSDLMKNTGVRISKVVVWETENCYAEATI